MTIKLVRTDTISPHKVNLPKGEHVFGRGKVLDCNDKRISREHGELVVSDDSLTIKALHQNPCFIQKKESKQIEILKLHNTTILNNGDRFGLLPDTYWFEVLVSLDESEQNTEPISENDTEELEQADYDKTRVGTNKEESILNLNCNDDVDTNIRPESPSLLASTSEGEGHKNYPSQNETNVTETHQVTMTHSDNQDKNRQNDEGTRSSPSKRPHSLDNVEAKKIKTEPILQDESNETDEPKVKEELKVKDESEVKDEPPNDISKPGSSRNEMQAAQADDNVLPAPPARRRERCMYGWQCYRRNPDHSLQYSHPRDEDWGDGAQAMCPYGAACRRRNRRHWATNQHPPGALPLPRPGMRVVERFGNVMYINAYRVNFYEDRVEVIGDDDSVDLQRRKASKTLDVPQDLPPKRVRKPVLRPDCFDSDSEPEDPYGTDESDEWEPDSNTTNYSDDYI